MATVDPNHRMSLWAAEEQMEDDPIDLNINMAANYSSAQYDENYNDNDTGPQIDEATVMAMQNHMAFSQIPDVVKTFIVHFHQAVLDNNLAEITVAYESGWNKLTEKFYSKTEWPEAEVIAPLVNDDQIFLILYRELYYRHVYSRLQPNIDDRFHSYENSCELFNYLLNSDGPVDLQLPEQWLWDIIDEFIYQFSVFCTWRSKVKSKTDDELMMLADGTQIWSSYSVLNVLYSLIQKSKINDYIVATQQGKTPGEVEEIVGPFGSKPLYRMLGYFSIIGLLRVHVLLGDFTLALKVMDNIELNQKSPLTRVTACHVTTYYYVGFCYVMLRRYPDAIRTFVTILNFIMRMRQYHTRSYQYDQISKTADRMYALFTICNSLSPSRLDDNIANIAKERFNEQFAKISRGGEEAIPAYEDLFTYAAPKFISSIPPPYEDPTALSNLLSAPASPPEPSSRHLQLFLSDVRSHAPEQTLRSFLKLYTSLDAGKLAGLLSVGDEGNNKNEEEVVQEMMAMKMGSRSISRVVGGQDAGKGLLEGETISTTDLNFAIDENMIHIAESTVGRRYAGWFIKNTERAQRTLDDLKTAPLPPPSAKAPANPAGATRGKAAASGRPAGQKVTWATVKA